MESADHPKHATKLDREKEWYRSHGHRPDHPLNSAWLFSAGRNDFNYIFPKTVMARAIDRALAGRPESRVLIAPLGRGEDLPYARGEGRALTGIDVSPEALAEVADPDVAKLEGDMSDMKAFATGTFDAVVTPLFFHHFILQGFDPFTRELFRVLKPGGGFVSLEPSVFNPLSLIARTGKRAFGNITGQVEDEGPFAPGRLTASLRRAGFGRIHVTGAGLCHNRTPVPVARVCNRLSAPFLDLFPFTVLSWMCVFTARKPGTAAGKAPA